MTTAIDMVAGCAPGPGARLLDPELRLEQPRLKALLAHWQGLCRGRKMPAREDLHPADLVAQLPHLMLTDVEGPPLRLRYRLIGTAITASMRRDRTGSYYDELYAPAVLAPIEAGFRWILENRRPLRLAGLALQPDRKRYRFELLNLPLSGDGAQVNMVLGGLILTKVGPGRPGS